MLRKMFKYNEKWQNIYKPIQDEVRKIVTSELHWNNGLVNISDFKRVFKVWKNTQKIRQRLFTEHSKTKLEWKQDINNLHVLAKKLNCNDEGLAENIKTLFERSRKNETRTKYPYLACSNRKQLINSDYYNPVYGFDFLIRPTTRFATKEKSVNNNFRVGSSCFALFFHVDLDTKGKIDIQRDPLFRLVTGSATEVISVGYKVNAKMHRDFWPMLWMLDRGKYKKMVSYVLQKAYDYMYKEQHVF